MSIQTEKITPAPVVLCFSGHDPSGGAGIQADIEAIAAQGLHAATVVTALTCQDSSNVVSFSATDAQALQQQAELILADMPVHAFKIGMTASPQIVQAIHNLVMRHPDIPLIMDPVLAAGGGHSLASQQLIGAITQLLVPRSTLLTPNIPEALALTGCNDIDSAARSLLARGAGAVLITGSHAEGEDITHRLYQSNQPPVQFHNRRLPYEYHGSGCTLASAIAALIASNLPLPLAVEQGLQFTFKSLEQARAIGHGQHIPRRISRTQS